MVNMRYRLNIAGFSAGIGCDGTILNAARQRIGVMLQFESMFNTIDGNKDGLNKEQACCRHANYGNNLLQSRKISTEHTCSLRGHFLAQTKDRGNLPSVGRSLHLLTDDNTATAKAVAAELGIDEVRAELMPEDKVSAIAELQKQGHRVAMIGDGINHAPALARADVGIAMGGGGTQAALKAADIALMTDDLAKLRSGNQEQRSSILVSGLSPR